MHLDIGAGDGRFLLEAAASARDTLFVAVDAAPEQFERASGLAVRRGIDNALFVHAAVEALPAELAGTADRLTVNYPWGSLLRAVAAPDRAILSALAGLCRPGAAVTILVNMSVFDDVPYCRKLGLPVPPVLTDARATRLAYAAAGLDVSRIAPDLREPPWRTSWGQKLVRGSGRRIIRLDAIARPQTAAADASRAIIPPAPAAGSAASG